MNLEAGGLILVMVLGLSLTGTSLYSVGVKNGSDLIAAPGNIKIQPVKKYDCVGFPFLHHI